MGRIARDGLDYFPMNCEFDDNVMILIAKHKHEGISILLRLWQKIYAKGYYTEWQEDNALLFSDKINVTMETLNAVIETCFKVEIFHRGIWERYGILTSSGIQKRWLVYVKNAKRQNVTIDNKYDVLLFIREETPVSPGKTPEEMPKTPEGMPRKEGKGRERKGKVKKKNTVGADAPDKKTPEEIEQGKIWAKLVDVWFVFYESRFAEKPSFAGRDPTNLKALAVLLQKKVLATPGFPWTEQSCGTYFQKFLQLAFLDDWLKTHFLLQNLVSQFDKIIAHGKNGNQPNGKPATGANIDTLSAFDKIDRYFGNAGAPGN